MASILERIEGGKGQGNINRVDGLSSLSVAATLSGDDLEGVRRRVDDALEGLAPRFDADVIVSATWSRRGRQHRLVLQFRSGQTGAVVTHRDPHVCMSQRQRVAQRDELAGALGRLDARNPRDL